MKAFTGLLILALIFSSGCKRKAPNTVKTEIDEVVAEVQTKLREAHDQEMAQSEFDKSAAINNVLKLNGFKCEYNGFRIRKISCVWETDKTTSNERKRAVYIETDKTTEFEGKVLHYGIRVPVNEKGDIVGEPSAVHSMDTTGNGPPESK